MEASMAIINGYATLADVKAAARITDTIDDALLEIAIESSSRDLDAYTERVFYSTGATAVARVYIPQDIYLVETDDIISVTSVKSDSNGNGTFDVTWETSDFQLEPLNGRAGGIDTPATRIRAIGQYLWPVYEPRNVNSNQASVQVTGVFGFATIPSAIKQATILASLRAYKRYESPTGVLGFSDMGVVRIGRLDPDVQRLVDPYRKVRMA
jgi:hypothetical protein